MRNGDLAVDMFFVLSGFLISHVLLKDIKKFGDVDLWNFYRNRFLRLWPVLAIYTVVEYFRLKELNIYKKHGQESWSIFTNLIFLNNYYFRAQHIWSVAVEF